MVGLEGDGLDENLRTIEGRTELSAGMLDER